MIIIGGGLAGLTSAIHLAMEGYNLLLLERYPYPHHKVCGEYVSNEIAPYLENLNQVENLIQKLSAQNAHVKNTNPRMIQKRNDFQNIL